jgi:hypothetical protein
LSLAFLPPLFGLVLLFFGHSLLALFTLIKYIYLLLICPPKSVLSTKKAVSSSSSSFVIEGQ